MSDPVDKNSLRQRTYCFLVLRLTLDQRGRLLQGELVDMTNTLRQRFTSSTGLNQAIEAWLKQQELVEEPPESESGATSLPSHPSSISESSQDTA